MLPYSAHRDPSLGNRRTRVKRWFTLMATRTALLTGQPAAFVVAVFLMLLWLAGGPVFRWSDTWQLVVNTATTIATFLMVFLIQNSQNRDAAAIQAKLDELIRVEVRARNEFVGIEHLTDVEIEAIRSHLEQEVADCHREAGSNELISPGSPSGRAFLAPTGILPPISVVSPPNRFGR